MIYYLPFSGSITVNDRRIEADVPLVVLITPSDLHSITVNEGSGGRFIKFAFTANRLGGWLTCRLEHTVPVSPVEADSPFADLLGCAHALLLNTNLRITEICYVCGYRSLSHFLRSFKKKFGLTPKALRCSGQVRQEDTE